MITVKLYHRTGEDKKTGFIYVSFYVNREKVHFSTKVQCDVKHWNERNLRISAGDKQAGDKNLIIESILSRINNVLVKYRLKDKKLTRNIFMKNYNRPDDWTTFHEFCEDYQKKTARQIEISTHNMHDSVLAKLKAFSPDLYFDDIDKMFLENYKVHLKKDLLNNDNTTYKNMAVIRKFVLAAIKAGYMEENPFEDFKVKQSTPHFVYLTEEDLQALYLYYLKDDYIEKYRKTFQCFLFMCFGSQHIGDAKAMKLEQFSKMSFTYYRMKTRGKKPEPVVVPISSPLRKIISDIVGDRKKGFIFSELPADQTMNEYLKKIAAGAGITKLISHKSGRHTFATIYMANNPNPFTLKDIMGHSKIEQTMLYAHVLEQTKQRGIDCFDKFK